HVDFIPIFIVSNSKNGHVLRRKAVQRLLDSGGQRLGTHIPWQSALAGPQLGLSTQTWPSGHASAEPARPPQGKRGSQSQRGQPLNWGRWTSCAPGGQVPPQLSAQADAGTQIPWQSEP